MSIKEYVMRKLKNFSILLILFVVLYSIVWFLSSDKKVVKLDQEIKNELIINYDLDGINTEDIVSFEHIKYMQRRANILIIRKSEENKIILEKNKNIERFEKLKMFSIYPNEKYIPYNSPVCCYYDEKAYYVSVYYGGSEYCKLINNYFWEIYKNSDNR